ncbi:hypothetical protein POVCU1_004660 [Plasmodium ovale curtisi]|uniref:Uncharacterized protein n=1 Tax=Plasmodium ovale curtisi TaxID=864141 RepID=A0A1A8VKL1_PLAOA|nr:hypothetical protein POVCU1_004660 [Plasmodium ovale curtisi]
MRKRVYLPSPPILFGFVWFTSRHVTSVITTSTILHEQVRLKGEKGRSIKVREEFEDYLKFSICLRRSRFCMG